MLYPSVDFERNCCIPSKAIGLKPQFSQTISIKRAITQSNIADDLPFRTWPVFYDALHSYKLWTKLMHPFKSYQSETKSVTTQMTTTLTRGRHDPYVSTMLRRRQMPWLDYVCTKSDQWSASFWIDAFPLSQQFLAMPGHFELVLSKVDKASCSRTQHRASWEAQILLAVGLSWVKVQNFQNPELFCGK